MGKSDFEKKKVKVGKKVKRANVTEIKVKSKKINVPLQNLEHGNEDITTRDGLNHLIGQLHHYSEPVRVGALGRLKDTLLASCTSQLSGKRRLDHSLTTLLLPEVIELVFNEEKGTRIAVREAASTFFAAYDESAFISIAPVLVTYICSGLTNLHKVIL